MGYRRHTPRKGPPWVAQASTFAAGLIKLISSSKVVIVALAAAAGFLLKQARDASVERRAYAAQVDSLLAAVRKDTSDGKRAEVFDWIRGRRLPDRMESYAIRKVLDELRFQRPLRDACVAIPTSGAPSFATRAFQAIHHLQDEERRPRSITTRTHWKLLDLFSERPVAPLARVELAGVDLRGAIIDGLYLQSATFERGCLAGASLDGTDLRGATFAGAGLDSASFIRAKLDSAAFVGARGTGVHFDRSDLRMADFMEAELRGADFLNAHLQCARFGNAILDSAAFAFADLSWAYFGGASLHGIERWSEVKSFTGANLEGLPPDDPLTRTALTRQAVIPDTAEQWVRERDRQRAAGKACARQPASRE